MNLGIVTLLLDDPCPEPILEQTFQSVQRQVGQSRRNDAALGCACLGGEQVSILDVSGFQPLFEDACVHGNVRQHPRVADVIERSLDVAFHDPCSAWRATQCYFFFHR